MVAERTRGGELDIARAGNRRGPLAAETRQRDPILVTCDDERAHRGQRGETWRGVVSPPRPRVASSGSQDFEPGAQLDIIFGDVAFAALYTS